MYELPEWESVSRSITTTKGRHGAVGAAKNNLWEISTPNTEWRCHVFVHKKRILQFKWFLPLGLFEEIYIKEMDAGVKKYQGQVFASQQSFDSNIKSLFPHRIPTFFILFILKWEKFLADIYVWTSDGASIIHMPFLKSREGKYLTSKHVSF